MFSSTVLQKRSQAKFCKFRTHSNINRSLLNRDLHYFLKLDCYSKCNIWIIFWLGFFFFSWHWGLWRGRPWWKLCLWIPHRSKTVRQARKENSRNSQDANVCYSTHSFYRYSVYQPFLTVFVQYFVDCSCSYNVIVVVSFWKYLSVFTGNMYCIMYCKSSFRSNILDPLYLWFFDTPVPKKQEVVRRLQALLLILFSW